MMATGQHIPGFPRILSRPLRVHWAGWETDTWRLQRAGWQLSAYQDIRGSRLQMAFQYGNRQKLQAITDVIPFPFMDMERDYGGYARLIENVELHVQQAIADQVMVPVIGRIEVDWRSIDAEPRYTTNRIERLEDLAHFAGPLIRTNEIIVPEESVPDLLEKILKMQQPARTDRIREELRGEHRQEQKFHAQIISLRKAG